jgi:hypothetical protein
MGRSALAYFCSSGVPTRCLISRSSWSMDCGQCVCVWWCLWSDKSLRQRWRSFVCGTQTRVNTVNRNTYHQADGQSRGQGGAEHTQERTGQIDPVARPAFIKSAWKGRERDARSVSPREIQIGSIIKKQVTYF